MKARTIPISEIFGPAIQGEGPYAGGRCFFVRVGGCDYRCSWCDTDYAVDPAQVRKLPRMSAPEIAAQLVLCGIQEGDVVILSGGNPALHELDTLLDYLAPFKVHVETQGSLYKSWLTRCELVVVSPKPPSSGMATAKHEEQTVRFVELLGHKNPFWILKYVAFDDADLDWAVRMRELLDPLHERQVYISAGTTQLTDAREIKEAVTDRWAWLCEEALRRKDMRDFRLGLQLHVLAWGAARGV